MTEQRTVVAHIHLFKNAGTSVERSLQHFFGERWVSHDPANSAGRFGQSELERLLIERPDVAAVSSHQLRPPLVDAPGFRFVPVVFVRHPLDRIRSAYVFERGQGGVSPSSQAAATSTFAEWIDFHRQRGSTQCTNFQTYALSSLRAPQNHAPLQKLPIEQHLSSAVEFLARLPAVGIVERYDEAWAAMTQAIATHVPGFDAPAVWANATAGDASGPDLDTRLATVRDELGAAEFERVRAENEADLSLHRAANELLDR